ncbi:hypothetical protein ACIBAG_06475 [Streptomyces sp. NPDC051243]|uniref:hypothetical protein n=1 Tax=Streptomyces sp. NPDC051243 TaxID=3365646 RepID=UPI00379C5721
MSSEWTVDETRGGAGQATGGQGFVHCGRFVAVAAPLALVALTAAWLFLGATPVRDAVQWGSLALLTVCLVVLGAAVVREGGRSRRETYGQAVRAASATPGRGEGTVPSRLGGAGRQSARMVGVLVAVPALVALWATLGAADGRGSSTSTALADAGAVIRQLPIAEIENEVAEGSSRRADATADFTVLLPSPGGGDPVPATFEATTNQREAVGNDLYVAYVPDRPGLGAIGDDQREDVERQLDGREVEVSTVWVIAGLWALATLGPLTGWWMTGSTRRRARTVGPDWQALRITVTGAGEHVDAPPAEGTSPADERKQRENTRRLKGLVLQGHGTEVPFHSQMSSEAAGAVLFGTHGWLLWNPRRRRGRDVPADLVGDDGWQLPGAVPAAVTERITEAQLTVPAHPDPQRRVRALDLGAGWLVTASVSVLAGWTVALGCLTALLLVPDPGSWRVWTAAAGLLVSALGFLIQGMSREDRRMSHEDSRPN